MEGIIYKYTSPTGKVYIGQTLDEERRRIMNLPLDRIEKIEPIALDYISCNIDFTEYFDDVVGVTIPVDKPVEEIHLKFTERRFSYVLTKPMHASQRDNKEECIVKLNLIPNKEFYSRLLSFGQPPMRLRANQPHLALGLSAVGKRWFL